MNQRSKRPERSPEERATMARLLPVFVVVLIDLLGTTIIIPLLPLYSASFGANAFIIGLLSAAYPVMQVIGAPLLGRLSDRYGRKPILVLSQLGTFAGFIIMGLANALPLLFVARMIDGLSGANLSTAQAVITDNTDEKSRTSGLALIGAAFGIGFTIGPVIAFLALAFSGNNYHVPAFVAAVFSLLSVLLTTFWLKESLPPEKRAHIEHERTSMTGFVNTLKLPTVGFLLVLMFVQQFVFGGVEQLLSLFTLNRLGFDGRANAILFVFIGLIVVVMLGSVIRVWSKQHSDRWIILTGLTTLTIGLVLTALTPMAPPPWYSQRGVLAQLGASSTSGVNVTLPPDGYNSLLGLIWILGAMLPLAIGGSVLSPTINSAITKRVSATQVGGVLGISAALVSAANALAPIMLGAVYQALGPSAPFFLGGVILLVCLIIVSRALKASLSQSQPAPGVQIS